jgi:integrase/recombinase XerD
MRVKLEKRIRGKKGKERVYLFTSIFFGYYPDSNGDKKAKRERKSMQLSYDLKPTTLFAKKEKKEALAMAERILFQREKEFQTEKAGLGKSYMAETNLFEWIQKHLNNTKMTLNNRNAYENTISKLKMYRGSYTLINQVDYDYCRGFAQFLSNTLKKDGNPLSSSTIDSYYKKLTILCKELVQQGILKKNPASGVKLKKPVHKRKEVLSKEEIQAIIETDCRLASLKNYFVFSCFTGMDNATCQRLYWRDYVVQDGVHKILLKRGKSETIYGFPLTVDAIEWINKLERRSDDDKIFIGLTYGGHQNNIIQYWMKDAGIKKHITPHCARHTFCYHFYKETKDLFTVMNVMAHKDLTTTQRYLRNLFNDYGDNYDAMEMYDKLNTTKIL